MQPATCVRVSVGTQAYLGHTVTFDQNPNVQERAPPAIIPRRSPSHIPGMKEDKLHARHNHSTSDRTAARQLTRSMGFSAGSNQRHHSPAGARCSSIQKPRQPNALSLGMPMNPTTSKTYRGRQRRSPDCHWPPEKRAPRSSFGKSSPLPTEPGRALQMTATKAPSYLSGLPHGGKWG